MIAIIGGTGAEGLGLGFRWAEAGYAVTIGSRTLDKALARASDVNARLSDGRPALQGMDNLTAVEACQLAVLTVPYRAHKATLLELKDALQGKILVDVTVPLVPPEVDRVQLPPGRAAGLEAQAMLGAGVRVVAAFQNISAEHMRTASRKINCDVLVCGDDAEARAEVVRLVQAAGMSGLHAGPLANAVAIESLTPVLISLNKHYGVKDAGIRVTGIPRDDD
jgi:hypothetical protein